MRGLLLGVVAASAAAAPGGGSFEPPTLGLYGWWDPASITGVSNGGSVSSWTDKVNGVVLTSTNATAPTLRTSGLGGQPVLSFDRTLSPVQRLLKYDAPVFDGVSGGTVYMVLKLLGNATQRFLFVTTATDGATRLLLGSASSGRLPPPRAPLEMKARRLDGDAQESLTGSATGTLTTGDVLAAVMDWSTGVGSLYVGGVAKGSATLTSSGSTSATNAAGFYVGSTNNADMIGAGMTALLGDLLVYEVAHDATTRAQIETYLRAKYGIA